MDAYTFVNPGLQVKINKKVSHYYRRSQGGRETSRISRLEWEGQKIKIKTLVPFVMGLDQDGC
jgi:hypothetical protein